MEITTDAAAPQLDPQIPDASNYRYSKVLELEKEMREEVLKYGKLGKKYKKLAKSIRYAGHISNGITFSTSTAAVSTILGGVSILATIPLASIGGISTLVEMGLHFVNNKLSAKVQKHTATLSLARMALANISRLTAKLLSDRVISQTELEAIVNVSEDYYKQKKRLREKFNQTNLERAFLNGEKQGRNTLIKKLQESNE